MIELVAPVAAETIVPPPHNTEPAPELRPTGPEVEQPSQIIEDFKQLQALANQEIDRLALAKAQELGYRDPNFAKTIVRQKYLRERLDVINPSLFTSPLPLPELITIFRQFKESSKRRFLPFLLVGENEVKKAKHLIFCGGASNYLDPEVDSDKPMRNTGRDQINQHLNKLGIPFFDPQIHPDTHGRDYDMNLDSNAEQWAREKSQVSLYELNPYSFGAVTILEIIKDLKTAPDARRVIFFRDYDQKALQDPSLLKFEPKGLDKPGFKEKHFKEMEKIGNNLRKYFLKFAGDQATAVYSEAELQKFRTQSYGTEVIQISPNQLHAKDLIDAYIKVTQGKKICVYFQDQAGPPPQFKPDVAQIDQYLDTYQQEGQAIRQLLSQQIEASKPEDPQQEVKNVITTSADKAGEHLVAFFRQTMGHQPKKAA